MKRIFYFNITYRCNQKCRFCFSHTTSQNQHRRDVSVLDFKNVLSRFNVTSSDRVILNGGEPSLHSDFVTFLALSKYVGAETVIYSNGTLFSERKLCNSMKYYLPSRITIPIHGNSQLHEYIVQKPGFYMKTLQGIRQLLAVHVPIELKFIITQDSVMGNFEIGEWLFRNGLQRVKQIVIVGQVSTQQSQLYGMRLKQDLLFGRYVARQLMNLLNAGYSVKIYDICFKILPLEMQMLIIKTYDEMYDEAFGGFYFFDGVMTSGAEVNYSRCPEECQNCTFRRCCKKITDSYLVLKMYRGRSHLVCE